MKFIKSFSYAALCVVVFSCNNTVQIRNGNLLFEINDHLNTKVSNTASMAKPLMNNYSSSEYLGCKNFEAKQFFLKHSTTDRISDQRGSGERRILTGMFEQDGCSIRKILEITIYDSFPDMALLRVQYVNTGQKNIEVIKWVNNSYTIASNGDKPAFWSFQGSSTSERKDWILPVDSSFLQKNFMGMNNSDYGGGIPVVDLWRKDAGIAIGHAELIPRLVSFPIQKGRNDSCATMRIEYEYPIPHSFKTGDTLKTFTTFVSVHTGDYYNSLQSYSKLMQSSGIQLAPVEHDSYEAVWCAWGYMRKFTVDEILGTLPKVKELGLKWVDIDDGFQQAEGDWNLMRSKFPNGNADMKKLVDQIHAMGLKAKLWWAPLAVDPGSKLLAKNPDILLENSDGTPRKISWWDSYYMSPVYQKTIDHTKSVIKMFLEEWNFDGLKIDGQHLNCVPSDYNKLHQLANPNESFEKLPEFYKMIFQTAKSYKPNAVVQICPCGCAMSFFIMPWTNQTVASDPTSSWQIRLKGKTYKALLGKTAYYGDHVEMSDGGNDFATQIGIGAVLGTKFTWPKDNPYVTEGPFLLTSEKEKEWKKWINIYNREMLPTGNYLGKLYDIGYDKPEGHVIQKSDTLFYAFYNKNWNGKIELRGLRNKTYMILDYVNGNNYGKVTGPTCYLNAKFDRSLLLQAIPIFVNKSNHE